ncbi:hypothetical protein [Caldalkalibacillus mannanilyticus]|uniref:hypothetical protein n=1 Tax=Caldalkalibacillus mannanilyticus TaxID=1418 RepID=UPI00046983CF|nr:hypothetical protein [Caldalkalibacillus mannanilyticus]
MRKALVVYLCLFLLLLGCSMKTETNSDRKNKEEINLENAVQKWELAEAHLKLYALNHDQDANWYKDMVVEFHDQTKRFPSWENSGWPTYAPKLFFEDLSQDGKEEMIIILKTAHGTGTSEEDIFILNPETLEEISIQTAPETATKHAKATLSNDHIKIMIDDKLHLIPRSSVEKEDEKIDQVYIGIGYYSYSIHNGILTANVAVFFDMTGPLGEIKITYTFKDGKYQAESINFEPLEEYKQK